MLAAGFGEYRRGDLSSAFKLLIEVRFTLLLVPASLLLLVSCELAKDLLLSVLIVTADRCGFIYCECDFKLGTIVDFDSTSLCVFKYIGEVFCWPRRLCVLDRVELLAAILFMGVVLFLGYF